MTTKAKWHWGGIGAATVVVLTIIAGIPTALTAGGNLLSIPDKVVKSEARIDTLELHDKEQAVINERVASKLTELQEGQKTTIEKLDYLIRLELERRRN